MTWLPSNLTGPVTAETPQHITDFVRQLTAETAEMLRQELDATFPRPKHKKAAWNKTAIKSTSKEETDESKENVDGSLELEQDTFKIDSTGREEMKGEGYQHPRVRIKVHANKDVIEYMDWDAKGEQLFTYDALIREVSKAKNCSKEDVEKKYLMTEKAIEDEMKDKEFNSKEYKEFYEKEFSKHLAWFCHGETEEFINIGESSNTWLAGKCVVYFDVRTWYLEECSGDFYFSVRLRKQ